MPRGGLLAPLRAPLCADLEDGAERPLLPRGASSDALSPSEDAANDASPPDDDAYGATAACEDDDASCGAGTGGSDPDASLWAVLSSLALPLYLPMLLLFFAWGLLTPVLPLFAAFLGATPAEVGAVAAARAVGALAATLPAGAAVTRVGSRAAAVAGASAYAAACAWGLLSQGIVSLALSRALAGAGYALYSLAQQTHVRLVVPVAVRGRILASIGGTYRVASALAPLAGGAIAQRVGFRAVFAVQLASCVPAVPLIAACMKAPQKAAAAGGASSVSSAPLPPGALRAYVRANWRQLAAAWVATLLMSLIRGVRDLLLPLAAAEAGRTRAGVGALTAASYACDTALFPLGGWLLDRAGCWAAGAAASAVMALGLLPLSRPGGSLLAAAMITGVGNGLSSGIVMALGADLAPANQAGTVLGSFNFVAALGGALGPLAVGALAQAASLQAAAGFATALSLISAVWWGLCLPRKRAEPVVAQHAPPAHAGEAADADTRGS
jgi:MFS family permease